MSLACASCMFFWCCRAPAPPRYCSEPVALHCFMSAAFVLGLHAGLQGSLCGLVRLRQQVFRMSAFGDWTRSLLVLCIAAAEGGGGTPTLAVSKTGQCLLMVEWMRLCMVMGYC